MLRSEPKKSEPDLPCEVGYAWFFENIIVFGPFQNVFSLLNNRKASRFGKFLGVMKGVVPKDPYCILYVWLHDSKSFKQRRVEKHILSRLGLSRPKMKKMKWEGQQELLKRQRPLPKKRLRYLKEARRVKK